MIDKEKITDVDWKIEDRNCRVKMTPKFPECPILLPQKMHNLTVIDEDGKTVDFEECEDYILLLNVSLKPHDSIFYLYFNDKKQKGEK